MRFVLLFQKLSTRPSFCSSSGIVSPCATTEKTTTPNGAIRISSWSVKDVVEAPHQEGALVHPLLDGAERGARRSHGAGRGCLAWPSVGRRTVGRQPLDGENDDAHGHEKGARNLSLLGHQDEGEYDQYRTDDPLDPLM